MQPKASTLSVILDSFRLSTGFLMLILLLGFGVSSTSTAALVSGIQITKTTPVLNPAKQTYDSYITLTNSSKKKLIHGPLALQINSISKKAVTVDSPSGTINNKPYIYIPLPTGVLPPRQTIGHLTVSFKNTSNRPFKFTAKIINQIPGISTTLPNHLPVAAAGNDQTVMVGNHITLDGSDSSDPEGQSLSYQWTLLQKPPNSAASFIDANQPRASLFIDQPGQYQLQLVVNDGQVAGFPDTVILDTQNSAPVAKPGLPMTAPRHSTVSLDGSDSMDSDAQALSHLWSLPRKPGGSKAKIIPTTAVNPALKLDKSGNYTAQLVVSDGQKQSDPATVNISTLQSAPVSDAGSNTNNVPLNQPFTLSGSLSSDADHDPLTYRWSLLYKPTGSTSQLSDVDKQECQITPDITGDYIAQLIVNDKHVDSAPDTVLINVTDGNTQPINHEPQITSAAVTSATVLIPYRYSVTATDADVNDPLTFTLIESPSGMSVELQTGMINWIPQLNQIGLQAVTVKVQDSKGGSATQSFQITVNDDLSANQVRTPNLLGTARFAAHTAIEQAKLILGTESYQNSDTVAEGLIISQNLASGAIVAIGTAVNISISLGPNNGLPPNPETVAPPLDATVATTTYAASEFLYKGNHPIQTLSNGQPLNQDTIEAKRTAVVSGKVMDKQNNPLSGVTIGIKDHPEFGQTLTRTDGRFDLAVNGGGLLTLNYAKTGLLPAQRQVQTTWQDASIVDDVHLIPADTKVTTVDFSAATTFQAVQANPITDADGTRQATLLIPPGTIAQIYNADGTTRTVKTLNLRLTEYTVGENGPQTMPAPLPASSGYTYAFEITADEAPIKIAGKDVLLNQPAYLYLENFLGFPTGLQVPMGYYDRDTAAWIASPDGRVIKIVNINNGVAELDTDTDGLVDNGSAIGISQEERQKLAGLYTAGQSLQRVPLYHFSTYDPNHGVGCGKSLNGDFFVCKIKELWAQLFATIQHAFVTCHSIIECENQTLGETIPLNGSAFTLNYRSDRAFGRSSQRTVIIPISAADLPTRVKSIQLDIRIAGRLMTKTFPAKPNQNYTFVWDGKDAYGRTVQGSAKMSISLHYAYPGYYNVPPYMAASFGVPSGQPIPGNIKSRSDFIVSTDQSITLTVGTPPEQSIGGWSLSPHHRYDPIGKRLYLGDGRQRNVSSQIKDQTLSTIAGNGLRTVAGDGGTPKNASVADPVDLAVAADGTVYVVDGSNNRIRKIVPDGIITRFAGAGRSGFSGDGGQATLANMDPVAIALDADGNLFVSGNNRVRKIDKIGIISTVVGNGQNAFSGDGGLAINASLRFPSGIAMATDGTLYIADRDGHRIRRVGTDGIIQTIAGTGQAGFGGDGGPANLAQLNNPNDIAIAKDGSLLVTDKRNHRIRRITPDGMISTVAGNGQTGGNGDGGLAINAQLNLPNTLSISNDGSIYVADLGLGPSPITKVRRISVDGTIATVAGGGGNGYGGEGSLATSEGMRIFGTALGPDNSLIFGDISNFRVRQVSPLLPGYTHGDINIPSEDGTELYHFEANGRHLHTYDTVTGTTLYTFAYDSKGRLIAITDALGKVTTIERDGQGRPTAVVAPYAQRTVLTTDPNGYLATVTNAANESFVLNYADGGLLTGFKNPRGFASTFSYDSEGLLLKDTNAEGGSVSLARNTLSDGHEVSVTTTLGNTTRHETRETANGDLQRTHTQPDGTQVTTTRTSSGITQATSSDGTRITAIEGPDPRFSMLAPLTKTVSISTGGLVANAATVRTATLSDPNNPLSLTKLTDSVVINGRTSSTIYDAATKIMTSTSPAGRKSTATIDALGRVLEAQLGNLLPVDMTYDDQGRPKTLSQGSGADLRSVSLTYDTQGYLDTVTDPLGRQVSFDYDAVGRVSQQTLPDNRVIEYHYDANGNLTSLTPPGKPAHVFHYNKIDQTTDYVPPPVGAGNHDTVYSYDLDKKPLRIERPDGQIVSFAYDTIGRLTGLNLGVPPSAQTLNSYSYHASTGKLAGMTTGDGEALAYSYNQALLTGVTWTGEINGSIGAAYDNDFRVTSLSVNAANPVRYSYDADSLLTKAGSLSLSHDSNGFLSGSTLGSVTDSYSYSNFGEMSRYTAKFGANPLLDVQYSRDALGRISQKVEMLNDGVSITYQYSYDTAGRLAQVKRNGVTTASYSYDSNGNRLTAPNLYGAAVYDDQDRLLQYGDTSYDYNANGELQSKTRGSTVTHYQYDVLGNLKQVVLPNGTQLDYPVDGRNRRIGKKRNGTLVQSFLYQDQLKPIAELDGNNQVISRFVYATHANVPDYMIKGGATYRIVTDHLGSPRLVVNTTTGSIAQQLNYDEWGNVLLDSNPGFQPFGFAGGLYDRDTGLVRFGARDYDSTIGRLTAKDIIWIWNGEVNIYNYAANDPLNLIDPKGKTPQSTKMITTDAPPPKLLHDVLEIREQMTQEGLRYRELNNTLTFFDEINNRLTPYPSVPIKNACEEQSRDLKSRLINNYHYNEIDFNPDPVNIGYMGFYHVAVIYRDPQTNKYWVLDTWQNDSAGKAVIPLDPKFY